MNCLNCENENTRDYPLCQDCETSRHFTNREDCRCNACERETLEAVAWEEELKLNYGWPVQVAIAGERSMNYQFTPDQLFNLLDGTIKMFIEYRDVHGYDEIDGADIAAISEMLEGLDAEQELADAGECKPMMQTYVSAAA